MSLNESIVEDATLEWFGELGYAVGHRHGKPGMVGFFPCANRPTVKMHKRQNRVDFMGSSAPQAARSAVDRSSGPLPFGSCCHLGLGDPPRSKFVDRR